MANFSGFMMFLTFSFLLFSSSGSTTTNVIKNKGQVKPPEPNFSSLPLSSSKEDYKTGSIGEIVLEYGSGGGAKTKDGRPFITNSNTEDKIKKRIKDIDAQDFGTVVIVESRKKRKAPDRSWASLRKKLNEEKKKEEMMAADANPRMEPNQNNTPIVTGGGASGSTNSAAFGKIPPNTVTSNNNREDFHFGGINTEQNVATQKKDDKIRLLHLQRNIDRMEKRIEETDTDCDFEMECMWQWRRDIADGFYVTSANKLEEHENGPSVDASNKDFGNFLILHLTQNTPPQLHVTSPLFTPSRNSCRLQIWIYQENMQGAEIRVVAAKVSNHSQSINKNTQWLVGLIRGDNSKRWEKHEHSIGKISDNFTIFIEVVSAPNVAPGATIAFDNIALIHCYPKTDDVCTPHQYHCTSTTNCINNTSICDITQDCPLGDDERLNCDKMPHGARCTFEEDWCGWFNVEGKKLDWTRHNGSTPTNFTGPNFDHTYMNSTGKYLYVNMLKEDASFASSASLQSVVFNPPPTVHGNSSSRFYNSCAIRFYLHQTGKHKSGILLQVTEMRPTDNYSTEILWSYVNHGDKWVRHVVILPNITHRYFIHFDAKRGYRYISDIAIDDVSLTPECFGLNIPASELGDYNYWNPSAGRIAEKETHKDFLNEPYYEITTCGAKGRYGPNESLCEESYNNSNVKISMLREPGFDGVQKWAAPRDEFYTLIISGASGGKGSAAVGSSRGAMTRIVLELRKGQEIFILVGQEGTSACVKALDHQGNTSCLSVQNNTTVTGIRGVLYTVINDGGGGGGGGTFVFLRNKKQQRLPLAVAAGGGGLGLGRFIDTGRQHGQAINTSKPPYTGKMYGKSAGAGGGWKMYPGIIEASHLQMMGRSVLDGGGIGGKACYNSTENRGDGGFGGGGGGCQSGGSGGGYAGGDGVTISANTSNGEGGYSFIETTRVVAKLSEAHSAYNAGPGSVVIVPAIPGCECNFRCVALDARRSQTVCICPKNWILQEDGKTCLPAVDTKEDSYPLWFVIMAGACLAFMVALLAIIFFILYNRYQHRASGILRRKMLSGADLQLDRLRVASDSMMTEYNPNYEFGGVVYTLKDLKDIPRDQLRLVKNLTINLGVFCTEVATLKCLSNELRFIALLNALTEDGTTGHNSYCHTLEIDLWSSFENIRKPKYIFFVARTGALGQGAFGEVYQGFYRQRPCDTVEMPVAVKTLPEMSTTQAEMDFLMEALIMSKFNHPNIVHFIGVCFDKHPRFIVLELLAGGDLKNFLREVRPKPERSGSLSMKDLVLIAVDVAKGCKYLEDNRFIHRDIAARNCLLTTKGPGRVVKIADFGMSRDVYRSDYYRKGGKAMLPIKWMPPEAFLDGIFTSKTDVWSFGVLLWEIMSMGYMPYTGCANREVMQLVTSGGRLDPPANCPGPIYGIMTQCWHPAPEQRPTFGTILERLGYCVQDPQVMSAPLPVFNRPPSAERDLTVMRPTSSEENCLQVVPQSSDYLIPNHTANHVSASLASSVPTMNSCNSATSSVEKLLPPDNSDSWETSLIMPQSRSTQPLLLECQQQQQQQHHRQYQHHGSSKDSEQDGAVCADHLLPYDAAVCRTAPPPYQPPKTSPMVGSSAPHSNQNNNNNSLRNDVTNSALKSGISLDAGALASHFSNPTTRKDNNNLLTLTTTGNGVLPTLLQNGPTSASGVTSQLQNGPVVVGQPPQNSYYKPSTGGAGVAKYYNNTNDAEINC